MGQLELQLLLPDEIPASEVLDRSAPTLPEIMAAVKRHYRLSTEELLVHRNGRGILVVLAKRYTRITHDELGDWIGRARGTISSLCQKCHGRMEVDERLRDDRDVIERIVAHLVLLRTGAKPWS